MRCLKFMFIYIILISFIFPYFVHAQTPTTNNLSDLINVISGIINSELVALLVGIALIVFIWGVTKYVISTSEKERKNSVGVIIYGVIAMFAIISVWGLVNVLENTLNLSDPGVFRQEKNSNDLIRD